MTEGNYKSPTDGGEWYGFDGGGMSTSSGCSMTKAFRPQTTQGNYLIPA